jgi:hypothetical protein
VGRIVVKINKNTVKSRCHLHVYVRYVGRIVVKINKNPIKSRWYCIKAELHDGHVFSF